jgi:hypothetical protein
VLDNYGYKLFLDDLPSATIFSEVQYTDNIPVGYLVSTKGYPLLDGSVIMEAAIFNHLEIKVKVHPNLMTQSGVTTNVKDASFKAEIYGQQFEYTLP